MSSVPLVASGYLWRCPECDNGNVSRTAAVNQVKCGKCDSVWPVLEVRHRTHDFDIQPGKAIGALKTVRIVVRDEETESSNEKAEETNEGNVRYEKELLKDGGVLLVASGYSWICPVCQTQQYIRSPLKEDDGSDVEDGTGRKLICEVCKETFDVTGIYHLHNKQPFGPPISISKIFIPPVKEVRREQDA